MKLGCKPAQARNRAREIWFGVMVLSGVWNVAGARSKLARIAGVAGCAPNRDAQLLIDVSVIVKRDAGTGIQRVVRELVRECIANPPGNFAVRTVSATAWRSYRYEENYRKMHGGSGIGPAGKVEAGSGDVFLGLDFSTHALPRQALTLTRWKANGVRLFFLVHDLLPVMRPDWFPVTSVIRYRKWIRTIAIFADSIICISRTVALDFERWIADSFGRPVADAVPARWFHLGGDYAVIGSSKTDEPADDRLLSQLRGRSTVLMVGTIEPRKGHAQVLSAFENLWRGGADVSLVIAGRVGWNVGGIVRRMRTHAESGKRLFWLERADDDTLRALYRIASGVLVASEGEGFGLPLAEAAQHSKPILARDLPVFREVAGDHAEYFTGNAPDELAAAIGNWLGRLDSGCAVRSAGIRRLTWKESAFQMMRGLALDSRYP